MLAGLPNYSWLELGRIYRVPGARNLFDVVAVHPYTKTPQGVLTILGVRAAGDERGRRLAQADHRGRDQLALVAGQDDPQRRL